MDRDGTKRMLREGDRVEVKTRFSGTWATGFEVAATTENGCRVRRVSDGALLPALFAHHDIRPASAKRDRDRDDRGNEHPPVSRAVRVEHHDATHLRLRLPATVDAPTVEALRPAVLDAVDAASEQIIIDLDAVEFLDSDGIRLLVALQRHACQRDTPVRLYGGSPLMRALLDLVALDSLHHRDRNAHDQQTTAHPYNNRQLGLDQ
jgi:anti-anti-sigma factor